MRKLSNHYRCYLLTPNGIDTSSSVISAIGTPMTGGDWYGQMKFSPNGKMLATAMDLYLRRLEIYRFDNNSGYLSNRIILSDIDTTQTGISFSPDNSKLYVGKSIFGQYLFQYDVFNYDSAIIANSKILLYNSIGYGFRVLQNAPDGRIYVNHALGGTDSSLSIINNPNGAGMLCNFSFNSFYLGGRIAGSGLCDINESYFNQIPDSSCTSTGVNAPQNNLIQIFPNLARDWIEVRGNDIREIKLLDLTGRMIYQLNYSSISSINKINVSRFPRGIYVLSMQVRDKTSNQKIILQ